MSVTIEHLAARIAAGRATATGVSAPAAGLLAGALAGRGGTTVVVTPDAETARAVAGDAALFVDAEAGPPVAIPGNPSQPYAELSADRAEVAARMAALGALVSDPPPPVVALSARSLARLVIARPRFAELCRRLARGDELDRDAFAAHLVAVGYQRLPVVDDPGTFAVRGGIIDLFPPSADYPVRLELFGDEIESLRRFDPETQRTLRELESVVVHPAREIIRTEGGDLRTRILAAADAAAQPSRTTRELLERLEGGEDFVGIEILTPAFHERLVPLWTYFPEGSRLVALDPDGIREAVRDQWVEAERRHADRLEDHRIAFPPAEHYTPPEAVADWLASQPRALSCPRLELAGAAADAEPLRLASTSNRELARSLDAARHGRGEVAAPLIETIESWRSDGFRVALLAASAARGDRIAALLEGRGIEVRRGELPIRPEALEAGGPPVLFHGRLSAGIQLSGDRLALLTDDDVFGERRAAPGRERRAASRARDALLGAVADFSQLAEGDYLVHQTHGVGRYRGLAKLPVAGPRGNNDAPEIDFLNVEYLGGTLYLPVYRIGEVQRYVGSEGHKVRLDRLGGASWDKARRKVRRDVAALAEKLLQLYAQRAALPGRAFPPADAMFRDFESTFEYEETPDQATAIADVLGDMEKPRPMDRLICGDVGYGKTEVALRAIFKATLGGAQAAMLAPTTVLVEQHYLTMRQRFADWPVRIARLSRFQKRAEQLATIRGLASGEIDAVVGTHRLLSRDVRFKDLGLIVVDEEQRFGVAHKERLKAMRTQTDVLTLTATPIPRTLHLAMSGLRDLSIIATPPADRRSIRTFIARGEDGILREGIRRELARGGQVFVVVPRIGGASRESRTLEEWAEHLADLIPEARVGSAHGQMSAEALEKAMVAFVDGEVDILVSTTIVESGLDISRANTMFVADADRFGLAQLYQLRGRIGRARDRAYCYLLIGKRGKLTGEAVRRLETLQRFSDLGAGFMIASHDLEIRGAGELLGSKQSGFIASVGFDTYTAMLEEAVAELRGEPIHRVADPELSVETPGYIPDDYVPDTGQRLVFYKRLSAAESGEEIEELVAELTDRYGPVPGEVVLLAELMEIKALARDLRATSIDLSSHKLALALAEETPLDAAAVAELLASEGSRYQLTRDQRLVRRWSEDEARSPTEAARRCLLELARCVTSTSTPAGSNL